MTGPVLCPACGMDDVEMRGQRRVYAQLDDTGQIDGWNDGEVDWDVTDDGKDLLYCNYCDHEWGRP